MKALIQRVSSAEVKVEGGSVASIDKGLLVFFGLAEGDTESKLQQMASKVVNLRIFSDEKGRFQHSVKDLALQILVVPQFTLLADTSKGRRPEFFNAMKPEQAEGMFIEFCKLLEAEGISNIAKGVFGADMKVSLCNDGPVTIMLEK